MKRSTPIVAVVLLLLVGYIYFFERDPIAEEHAGTIFEIDEASIEHIEIRARDEDGVVAEHRDGSWMLTAPLSVEADEDEISLLLENLRTAELDRAVGRAGELELEDFGLDEPALEIGFRAEGGIEGGLQFGKDTPTGTTRYARRLGDDEILVVASHLSNNFTKTAWDLRDKRVFDYGEDAVPGRVEIRRPEGELVLENVLGLWFVSGETRARADRLEVESLVSGFRRAEMRDVVSETAEDLDLGSLGLDPFRYALQVEWVDETIAPLEIHLGQQSTLDVYARAPARPQVFLLDGALVEDLRKEASAYRSDRLFDYATGAVRRVRVHLAGDSGGFDVESSEEAKWPAVEDLLVELSGVRAQEIVESPSLDELALRHPAVVVTVWSGAPEREETLRVGEPVGESVFAQRDGDDVALRVAGDAWVAVEELLSLGERAAPE